MFARLLKRLTRSSDPVAVSKGEALLSSAERKADSASSSSVSGGSHAVVMVAQAKEAKDRPPSPHRQSGLILDLSAPITVDGESEDAATRRLYDQTYRNVVDNPRQIQTATGGPKAIDPRDYEEPEDKPKSRCGCF